MAKINEAVRIPIPKLGPLKMGRNPKWFIKNGATDSLMMGTKKKIPQSPKTILGMAAIISTMIDKKRDNLVGKYSVINIAIRILTGAAKKSARNDVTNVPKTKDKAPNSSSIGSQFLLIKNLNPKALMAGREESISV